MFMSEYIVTAVVPLDREPATIESLSYVVVRLEAPDPTKRAEVEEKLREVISTVELDLSKESEAVTANNLFTALFDSGFTRENGYTLHSLDIANGLYRFKS